MRSLDNAYKNPDEYNWTDQFGNPCNPLQATSVSSTPTLAKIAKGFFLGVEAQAKSNPSCFPVGRGIEEIKLYKNYNHNFKHYPNKNLKWKEIIKSTKDRGIAKYKIGENIPSLEEKAFKNGYYQKHRGYVWYKDSNIIGASNGKETKYIRIDVSKSSKTYHGHPVTRQEVVNQAGSNVANILDKK